MSRVFITNATGFIGTAVAKALKCKGHDVTALARSDQAEAKLRQEGYKVERGDIKQPQTFVEALKAANTIIHTASTGDAEAGKYDARAVDTIIETLKHTNKTFIYTSGVWVFGDTGDRSANENTPLNPIELVSWRIPVEQKVLAAGHQGIRTIIIRPSLVYGYNGGIVGRMMREARNSGETRYVGNGENRWATVHVDDLADLYMLAMENAPTGGALYLGSYGPSVKVQEVVDQIDIALGTPGKAKGFPVELARFKLGLYADALVTDQQIDSSKTQRDLDWRPSRANILEDLAQGQTALTM